MSERPVRLLRVAIACLTLASGTLHIIALWFRPLDSSAVFDTFLGTAYIVLAIGLFGRSRFSLFLALLLPALAFLHSGDEIDLPEQSLAIRYALDWVIAAGAAVVLWQVRNEPSQ